MTMVTCIETKPLGNLGDSHHIWMETEKYDVFFIAFVLLTKADKRSQSLVGPQEWSIKIILFHSR
jgi:hypothetical protein